MESERKEKKEVKMVSMVAKPCLLVAPIEEELSCRPDKSVSPPVFPLFFAA